MEIIPTSTGSIKCQRQNTQETLSFGHRWYVIKKLKFGVTDYMRLRSTSWDFSLPFLLQVMMQVHGTWTWRMAVVRWAAGRQQMEQTAPWRWTVSSSLTCLQARPAPPPPSWWASWRSRETWAWPWNWRSWCSKPRSLSCDWCWFGFCCVVWLQTLWVWFWQMMAGDCFYSFWKRLSKHSLASNHSDEHPLSETGNLQRAH